LIVYANLPKDATGETTITLTAESPKGPFITSTKINLDQIINGQFIPKLAARSAIKDFESGRSYLHDENGAVKAGANITKEITDLSLKNQVLSKYTAFVAVEQRTDAVEGAMKIRNISIEKSQVNKSQVSPRGLSKQRNSNSNNSNIIISKAMVQRQTSPNQKKNSNFDSAAFGGVKKSDKSKDKDQRSRHDEAKRKKSPSPVSSSSTTASSITSWLSFSPRKKKCRYK